MNPRGHEAPMDFEWQTSAPADTTSPFYQLAQKHRKNDDGGKHGVKRSHSVFDTPLKQASAQLQAPPGVPLPPAQPFLFSPPSPVKRFLDVHNPNFTTPRKPDPEPCSSGAEFSSPDYNNNNNNNSSSLFADTEDTPERPSASETSLVRIGDPTDDAENSTVNGKNGKNGPIFAGVMAGLTGSGRGEPRRGKYADAAARKVRKRRRHEINPREMRLGHHRPGYHSESDDTDQQQQQNQVVKRKGAYEFRPPQPQQHQQQQQQDSQQRLEQRQNRSESLIASVFGWIESHPQLPHVLSFYVQLLLNFFVVCFVMYVVYSFWSTVRSDVDKQSEAVAAETLAEMAACAQQFVANRCDREHRVPAMETVCDGWERCMNKDPNAVGRARVSAHTFAEIFNSFVEPISYKTMLFFLIAIFGCVAVSNFGFGLIRAKVHAHSHAHAQAQQQQQHHHHQAFVSPSSPAAYSPSPSASYAQLQFLPAATVAVGSGVGAGADIHGSPFRATNLNSNLNPNPGASASVHAQYLSHPSAPPPPPPPPYLQLQHPSYLPTAAAAAAADNAMYTPTHAYARGRSPSRDYGYGYGYGGGGGGVDGDGEGGGFGGGGMDLPRRRSGSPWKKDDLSRQYDYR